MILLYLVYVQHSLSSYAHRGETSPTLLKLTLLHEAFAAPPPSPTKLTFCSTIPQHGKLLLQFKFMAAAEALVP